MSSLIYNYGSTKPTGGSGSPTSPTKANKEIKRLNSDEVKRLRRIDIMRNAHHYYNEDDDEEDIEADRSWVGADVE